MAEEDQTEDEKRQDGKPEAGSQKKLLLLIGIGLVIVGFSVGGTLFALKLLGGPASQQVDTVEEQEALPEPTRPAIYYPIKPPIVVNFDVKGRQRYLQAELTLMMRDSNIISAVELHMPMIRNALLMLIGGQLYEEIQTAEGKELLRQQCLQELQSVLQREIGKPGIEQVLFTNFVMQ